MRGSSNAQPEVEENTVTANISSGGCFFYVSRKPSLGSAATMEIDVPYRVRGMRSSKLLCHGKVVRVSSSKKGNKVGVACTIDSYSFQSSPAEQAGVGRGTLHSLNSLKGT